ncbi:GNAT family N-acetyltransferase [Cytobacillus firmus]|uniref:GNAT family N-acetyltransferase n=1 Tax=Cytobacillus firmus TaxID=1399 RepID=UPI001C981498|nr:GNAT family N-acetyltransferase [Cytobacillus firmus]MBY6053664.1 GNAT family N-acetyltransferase [Cytobacillus firmus]
MDVKIVKAAIRDQDIVRNMYALYLHDLTKYTDALHVNDEGTFEFDAFSLIWDKEGIEPYLIKADGKLAGFLLLLKAPFLTKADCCINDFFLYNSFRGKKVGQAAVGQLFSDYKGTWYIEQLKRNKPAVRFWEKVYRDYQLEVQETLRVEDGEEVVGQFVKVE